MTNGDSLPSNPFDARIVSWLGQHGDDELLDVMTYMNDAQHEKMQAIVAHGGLEPSFEVV